MRGRVGLAALILLWGCGARPRLAGHATRAETARRATTDPGIGVANLEGALRKAEQAAAASPERQAELVDLLLTRGRFLGRIDDYERAAATAEALVARVPASPEAYLARAGARATFHRFDEAGADLRRAERLGGPAERVASLRAALLAATGHARAALAIRRRQAAERPQLLSLANQAVALGAAGQLAEAERGFERALGAYGDASPFPVAWLHFERGRLALRAGRLERARELFAAARAVLPQYAAATTHLGEAEAALGRTEPAIALLSEVARRSDDPDAAGQLARVLAAAGRAGEAEAWRRHAEARYEVLLERHPDAFAEHAAEFFLATGQDVPRALALARHNARLRQTPEACALLQRAAAAAAAAAPACRPADRT